MEAVEGQIIGIVVGVAVPRGTGDGNNVTAVKLPIYVLEGMISFVGMLKKRRLDCPVTQIGGRDQSKNVP